MSANIKTAGDAILENPNGVIVSCKACGIYLTGAAAIIDHLDAHN